MRGELLGEMLAEEYAAAAYPAGDVVDFTTVQSFISDQMCNEEGSWNMTNGDRIRSMSDEELADLLTNLISVQDHNTLQKLWSAGIAASLCEMPVVSRTKHLEWLKAEMEI